MNAFEVTSDDILNVLHKIGRKENTKQVQWLMEDINHFEVETAALMANDLNEQTNLAYIDLERQIIAWYKANNI